MTHLDLRLGLPHRSLVLAPNTRFPDLAKPATINEVGRSTCWCHASRASVYGLPTADSASGDAAIATDFETARPNACIGACRYAARHPIGESAIQVSSSTQSSAILRRKARLRSTNNQASTDGLSAFKCIPHLLDERHASNAKSSSPTAQA